MEQYLSAMVDAYERYTEAFLALVGEYTTLGEHISSLGAANQSYKDALTEALAQFNAAGGQHIDDLTILYLDDQRERFILASENLRDFIDSRFQQFRELVVSFRTNATAAPTVISPDNAQRRDRLVISSEGQGDMESDTRYGHEADVSEERMMAVSQDLADLDLNRPEPEETMENATAAQEKAVDHIMAESQVP